MGKVGKGGRGRDEGYGKWQTGRPANSTQPPVFKPFPPEKLCSYLSS